MVRKRAIDSMLQKYRKAASEHGRWTLESDSDKTNAAAGVLADTLKSLVAAGEDRQLFSLYDDADPSVQLWAAAHTLEVDEARAIRKLKTLQRTGILLVSLSAEYTIQSWRDGDLRFRD